MSDQKTTPGPCETFYACCKVLAALRGTTTAAAAEALRGDAELLEIVSLIAGTNVREFCSCNHLVRPVEDRPRSKVDDFADSVVQASQGADSAYVIPAPPEKAGEAVVIPIEPADIRDVPAAAEVADVVPFEPETVAVDPGPDKAA